MQLFLWILYTILVIAAYSFWGSRPEELRKDIPIMIVLWTLALFVLFIILKFVIKF